MCDIFQSTESSRFFVYCEVSINLFLLSCTLTVLTDHNSNISECPCRWSQVRFWRCCLSQDQAVWRVPKRKIPRSAPAKVTWVERFSSATGAGAVQGYYREIQAWVCLFYMYTSFNKHLLTCPVVKPQTAFPIKQRSSKFCKTPVGKCSGERWCHSLLCSLCGL